MSLAMQERRNEVRLNCTQRAGRLQFRKPQEELQTGTGGFNSLFCIWHRDLNCYFLPFTYLGYFYEVTAYNNNNNNKKLSL